MLKRASLIHLRIPFSYFLLPVFMFALSLSNHWTWWRLGCVFFLVHVFLYPASNGYNSYFDRDEGPIGGLKKPPPVSRDLYFLTLGLDAAAIVLGFILLGLPFALMLFIYGMVSKAYSHPAVRLKRWPWTSWLVAGFFQGFFTFLMCYVGLNKPAVGELFSSRLILAASLSTLLLWGSYPMTQIYQHEEDARRGDRTLSLLLGISGTFIFTAAVFTVATAGFCWFYLTYVSAQIAVWFVLFLLPVLLYFFYWFRLASRNKEAVNHTNAMRLNFISSTCLNLFFFWMTFAGP